MKKNTVFLMLSFILISLNLSAQRITIGLGNIANTNTLGPFNTNNLNAKNSFSIYAYIYTAASMPGILHNDSIRAIDFRSNGAALSLRGNVNCKIWLGNTAANNFGTGNVNFLAERLTVGAKLVFSGDIKNVIGNNRGFNKFNLDSIYKYDTATGKNLMLMVEYTQDTSQSFNLFWNCDNSFAVVAYAANQTKFIRDTGSISTAIVSNSSSDIHPQIRLDIPRSEYDGTIIIPYTYGKLPVPLGNPDTVKLVVINLGFKSKQNFKAYINSQGANVFLDSITISSLPSFKDTLITFPTRNIFNVGRDTLTFSISADSTPLGNQRTIERLATKDVYSYRQTAEPLAPGGIGFNGSTGNFVCKFSSNNVKNISQIETSFGFTGLAHRIGIWESNETTNRPGKLLWESPIVNSSAQNVLPVFPAVKVDGNFYVGVRQIGTQNISFAYQVENPVRARTFWYSAPLADTNWIDFAPGAPFRFAIEPRFQAEYDVMAFAIDTPKNNDTLDYFNFDTIRPAVRIFNTGAQNADTAFNIYCKMWVDGLLVINRVKKDTIKSGTIKLVDFDTAFVPPFSGNYELLFYTDWDKDELGFNDSLLRRFVVAYFNDIGPDVLYTPFNGQVLEFKADTLKPVFRIKNFAYNRGINFYTKIEIVGKRSGTVYADSLLVVNLNAGFTQIIGGFNWFANVEDTFVVNAISLLPNDRIPNNDTLSASFVVVKINDMSTNSITYPADNEVLSSFVKPNRPRVKVENFGALPASDAKTYISIRNAATNNVIYSDTLTFDINSKLETELSFIDSLTIAKRGKFLVTIVSRAIRDFEFTNDTLRSVFYYGFEKDAKADTILFPNPSLVYELNLGSYLPKVQVSNKGYDSIRNQPIKLEGLSNGVPFYLSSKTVKMDSNETLVLVMDDALIFSKKESIKLRLITLQFGDQNPSNDTFEMNYQVQTSNDVGVNEIKMPTKDFAYATKSVVFPSVRISNFGLANQLTGFPVNLRIQNPSGAVIYNKDEYCTIDSAEVKDVQFSSSILFTDTGKYTATARVILPTDQDLSNDLVTQNFFVVYGNNTAVLDQFPKANIRYVPGVFADTVRPSINLSKTGIFNGPDTGKAFMKITGKNSNYQYFDSIAYIISANKDTLLRFNNAFNTNIRDTFATQVWILANNDGKPDDDSIAFNFSIDFGLGVANILKSFSIAPNPTNGSVQIKITGTQGLNNLKVIDLTGKTLIEKAWSQALDAYQLDLSALVSGSYFVFINNSSEAIKVIKVGTDE